MDEYKIRVKLSLLKTRIMSSALSTQRDFNEEAVFFSFLLSVDFFILSILLPVFWFLTFLALSFRRVKSGFYKRSCFRQSPWIVDPSHLKKKASNLFIKNPSAKALIYQWITLGFQWSSIVTRTFQVQLPYINQIILFYQLFYGNTSTSTSPNSCLKNMNKWNMR